MSSFTSEMALPPSPLPVTVPVVLMVTCPPRLWVILMPISAPVTSAAVMWMPPAFFTSPPILMPSPSVDAVIAPDALMVTAPVPLETTSMACEFAPVPVWLTAPVAVMATRPDASCSTRIALPVEEVAVTSATDMLIAEAPVSFFTKIAESPPSFKLVTVPVAVMVTSPPPLWLIRMPMNLPVTCPTEMLSEAVLALFAAAPVTAMPSPALFELRCPVAVMLIWPEPLFLASMEFPLAVMPFTLMVTEPPAASWLEATTALPAEEVRSPVAVIEMFPAPEFVALITPLWPERVCPFADWVNVMPPAPVWVSVNAVPVATSTSVPAARVTATALPLPLSVTALSRSVLVPNDRLSKPDTVGIVTAPDVVISIVSEPVPKSMDPPTVPPARITLSAPPPSLTAPLTLAPVFTLTVAFPSVSTTASSFALPTTAPLLRLIATATFAVAPTLIADSSLPSSPVTVEDTLIVTLPVPLCSTFIPWRPAVVTAPVAVTSTVPPCSCLTRIPSAVPVPCAVTVATATLRLESWSSLKR